MEGERDRGMEGGKQGSGNRLTIGRGESGYDDDDGGPRNGCNAGRRQQLPPLTETTDLMYTSG